MYAGSTTNRKGIQMETSNERGNQCYQNGPDPFARDWQRQLLQGSQVTRWNV